MQYPGPIAKLIDSYMKLPGIGEKTATRLAFYTLGMDQKDVEDFAKSLLSVKKYLHYCRICGFILVQSAEISRVTVQRFWWLSIRKILWQWSGCTNTMASIMFCTVLSRQAKEQGQWISTSRLCLSACRKIPRSKKSLWQPMPRWMVRPRHNIWPS